MIEFETISLHRIDELPFDADAEIFRDYPGFKLGVARCVRHYAELLLPLLTELITNETEQRDWVLTAPAITARTPAGANLLAWDLFALFGEGKNTELSVIDLEHASNSTWADWKNPAKSQDYAKLEFADRVTEHELISRRLAADAGFRGRSIVFVNDIRVTGAQEHAMQEYFRRAEATRVIWMYLVVVDPQIGRAEPTIEWQINFAPFEQLVRMVTGEEIRFTGKCLQRLMSLSIEELDQVLRALNGDRKAQLLELALRNGFDTMDGFSERMELVRKSQR